MKESLKFRNNKIKHRFELQIGLSIAKVEYIEEECEIVIYKTEIPKEISGIENIAPIFLDMVIESCNSDNMNLQIQCPYAKAIVARFPQEAS